MGITAQGQLILTQENEEFEHRNLKMLMDFVNRFDKSVNTISLKFPFYIEFQDDKYILKCESIVKTNDEAQIRKWLLFLHKYIFYTSGIVSKGEFVLTNDENHEIMLYLCDENGILFKVENFRQRYLKRQLFIQYLEENPDEKRFYKPKLFFDISEKIEKHSEYK